MVGLAPQGRTELACPERFDPVPTSETGWCCRLARSGVRRRRHSGSANRQANEGTGAVATVGTNTPRPGNSCHMEGEAPEPGSDAEYLLRSLSQPEKFSFLYARHSPTVYRFLARQTDRQVAEDLLAQVFLTAFRIRERYDSSAPDARAWLLGIAANTARRHHRSESRFLRLRERVTRQNDMTSSEDFSIEQRLDAETARPHVAAALRELTPSHREVLLLSAFDLNYEEMAKALNVPVGTIRSRLSRARTQMRELLGWGGKYPLVDVERLPLQETPKAGEVHG